MLSPLQQFALSCNTDLNIQKIQICIEIMTKKNDPINNPNLKIWDVTN